MNSLGIDDSVLLELEKSLKEIEQQEHSPLHSVGSKKSRDLFFGDDDDDDEDEQSSEGTPTLRNRDTRTGSWDGDDNAIVNNKNYDNESNYDYKEEEYDEDDNDDDEDYESDEDVDKNPEQELSAMMNILVAELQAEIQEQIVREIGEAMVVAEQQQPTQADNITTPSSIEQATSLEVLRGDDVPQLWDSNDAEDHVPVQDYTTIVQQVSSSTDEQPTSILEPPVHNTPADVEKRKSTDDIPSSISERTSIHKTELIQMLQDHIAKRRGPGSKLKEWNVQPIPDLDVSDANENYESMLAVQPTDPDYVCVRDYSPRRKDAATTMQRSKRNRKGKQRAEAAVALAAISMPALPSTTTSSSTHSSPSGKRPRRRRTNKHQKQQNKQLKLQKKREQLEQLIFECAIPADHQQSRDEVIRQLAASPMWKAICQMTFQGKTVAA